MEDIMLQRQNDIDSLNELIGLCNIPELYKSFLKVLAEKDIYTYVHSLYTAKNSALLAKKLNLPIEKIKDIYIAGLLHDIGKILLPNEILKKPMKLTNKEYEQVKMHVGFSINVLINTNISPTTLNAIKCHHLRWDGLGYPEATGGNAIPLEGRILQIADAFTAMTIKRVYRSSLSVSQAIQELLDNRSTQFDPILVNLFIEILKEDTEEINNKGVKEVKSCTKKSNKKF